MLMTKDFLNNNCSNGIQGHHEISTIQELSVDVIVTDHHEIGETLPDAFAIVHPMHPNFEYPFKYLCGAGVAYKLAQGLMRASTSTFHSISCHRYNCRFSIIDR